MNDFVDNMVERLWEATDGENELDGTVIRRMAETVLEVQSDLDDRRMGVIAKVIADERDDERDIILALLTTANAPQWVISLLEKNTHRKRSSVAMRQIKVGT